MSDATQHAHGTSTSTATATLAQRITPGPWRTTGSLVFKQQNPGGRKWYIADCSMDVGANATIANAELISLAPTLLAQRDALLATVKQASEYLAQIDTMQPDRNHGSQGLAIRAQLRDAIALAGGGK